MGIILIAIVLGGFVPLAFSRPGGPWSMPWLLHLHGFVFLSWYVLFVVQARMIGNDKVALHMCLGKLSIALAITMVVIAYAVVRGAYANPDWNIAGFSRAASTMFPLTDIVNFSIVYSVALVNRRTADAHKRLMLMAGIMMIDPAVARLSFTAGAPPAFILLLELALFVGVIGYDLKTRRRPHWASLFGFGLFVLAMAAKFTIAHQPWWASFVDIILG